MKQFKIFTSIIVFDAIFVMNNFMVLKRTPYSLGYNKPMFENITVAIDHAVQRMIGWQSDQNISSIASLPAARPSARSIIGMRASSTLTSEVFRVSRVDRDIANGTIAKRAATLDRNKSYPVLNVFLLPMNDTSIGKCLRKSFCHFASGKMTTFTAKPREANMNAGCVNHVFHSTTATAYWNQITSIDPFTPRPENYASAWKILVGIFAFSPAHVRTLSRMLDCVMKSFQTQVVNNPDLQISQL